MSTSLSIQAFASKDSDEFQKHFKAVQFCIENELSYPKKTSEFFKGKLQGYDLEDINPECVLGYIENGVEIPLKMSGEYYEKRIKVSEIPSEVDEIVVRLR